ncbi:MAG: hypothetical protein HN742_14055 [Lentisphaerae bacterium]|jgi:hypothetical protein|nr:hypothetical protein [Lentisphaerota bacterium]MBT5610610.1 hypothetical protein [Lentisphaerota bacterium]MBT7054481.1 hypothetical protein [Lentisphaerota bacterium]MBT7842998.1 hypothetical protein [Lentisphaerota bacterium]
MNIRTIKTDALIEAGKRTAKTVTRTAQRWGKRGKAVADRHPGIVAGASIGYLVGRSIEWVPGIPGKLPRYFGAAVGASMGYVFEVAYREVVAEGGMESTSAN